MLVLEYLGLWPAVVQDRSEAEIGHRLGAEALRDGTAALELVLGSSGLRRERGGNTHTSAHELAKAETPGGFANLTVTYTKGHSSPLNTDGNLSVNNTVRILCCL